jgi:hypothetical protein
MFNRLAIDKDVPLASTKKNALPYKEMEVGDSFLVPEGKMQTISNSNWRIGKALGAKFTARRVDGGVRVWRVA